jgi:dipeptidyl aminopeptidase/acylaminoacyl peptidase
MKRLFFPLFVLLFLISGVEAQPSFTVSELMKVRRIGDPQISPDGATVAFTIGNVDVTSNRTITHIYAVPVTGGPARQITSGDRSHNSPRWSPDGKRLALTTGGQIWTMKPDGSDRRQVTRISKGANGPVWSPDGRWIAFSTEVYPECNGNEDCNKDEDERAENSKVQAKVTDRLLYRHWTEWRTRKRTHVFLVSSDGGRPQDLTPGDYDSPPYAASTGVDYAFSPDSREIAVLRNMERVEAISTNSDIFTMPIPGVLSRNSAEELWKSYGERAKNGVFSNSPGSFRDIANITAKNIGYDVAPVYTGDGKYILYRSQSTAGFEADRWRIMRYDRRSGETVELTRGFDLQVEEMVVSADNRIVYFTALQRGRSPIFTVPVEPDFRQRVATHVKTLLTGGFYSNLSLTPDDRTLVFASSSMTMPNEIFTAEARPDARPVPISSANAPLGFLQKAEEIEWKGALNQTIHGFLIKPANFDPNRKYPLLVIIHGGPQSAFNDSWGYRWNPQIFANAGYVVFQPNPRGSVGYGQRFIDDISGDWAGKVYTDLMNGVAEAIKRPYIDRKNIGAAGASYGGYMINWILGHNNDPRFRFKALHSHAGVYNLETMATVTEELWFADWEFKGMPWTNPVNYQRWSPHRFARNFKTPTLVTQGEIDYRVPVDQSLQLFTTLQLNNVESRLVVFPDEGHWILKPQNSIFWYGQVLGWFEKHLR